MNFFACSVCFGDPHSALSRGVIAAVFFLLAVVVLVLAGISATAFSWIKRAKRTGL